MKYADKIGARYTAVIGSDEIAQGTVNVKNMLSGESTPVALEDFDEGFIRLCAQDAAKGIGVDPENGTGFSDIFGL